MKPTRLAQTRDLVAAIRRDFPAHRGIVADFACDTDWRTREVAASLLVEAARSNPEAVLAAATIWAVDPDPLLRRVACEGLRGLARSAFVRIMPVLDVLRADSSPYVRKAVANLLRDASARHSETVLALARRWAGEGVPVTRALLRDGLKKLVHSHAAEVDAILNR